MGATLTLVPSHAEAPQCCNHNKRKQDHQGLASFKFLKKLDDHQIHKLPNVIHTFQLLLLLL